MRSPFAGMDPHLEPYWPGLHTRLVALATIEFISPSNKMGEGLERYLDKRADLLAGGGALSSTP